MHLDPRISGLLKRETPGVRFVAALLCAVAKPEHIEAALVSFGDSGIDTGEVIAGKPFLHWIGKSRQDLRRENLSPGQIAEISDAFAARGMQLASTDEFSAATLAPIPAPTPKPTPRPAAPKVAQPAEQPVAAANAASEASEPVFAGKKLSELAGKSDAELLKIEGIGPATIKEIRKAEKSAN